MLRQDPDVLMVGEMRDLDTATTAVQAALTGHQVFSTLHTNDAPSSITRLQEMGIATYLLTSTMNAVLAQRLVRTLCTSCKAHVEPPRHDLNSVSTSAVRKADGYVLNGHKSVVLNGDTADSLIVSARTSGTELEQAGISLLVVPSAQQGVRVRGYVTNDAGRAADITFDNVEVGDDALLGEPGKAFAKLEQIVDRATAAVCAESLGIMTGGRRACASPPDSGGPRGPASAHTLPGQIHLPS